MILQGLISGGSITGNLTDTGYLQGTMNQTPTLQASMSETGSMSGSMSATAQMQGEIQPIQPAGDYEGSYVVTPTQYTQTLPTTNKTLSQMVTINPIPSNYGLITWNGATLTVS